MVNIDPLSLITILYDTVVAKFVPNSQFQIESPFLKKSWDNLAEMNEKESLSESEDDPAYQPLDF